MAQNNVDAKAMRISVIEGHLTATEKRDIKSILEKYKPSQFKPVIASKPNKSYELTSDDGVYIHVKTGEYTTWTIGAGKTWKYFFSFIQIK